MTRLTIAVLRGVIVIGLAGSVFVQAVMVPLPHPGRTGA